MTDPRHPTRTLFHQVADAADLADLADPADPADPIELVDEGQVSERLRVDWVFDVDADLPGRPLIDEQ